MLTTGHVDLVPPPSVPPNGGVFFLFLGRGGSTGWGEPEGRRARGHENKVI